MLRRTARCLRLAREAKLHAATTQRRRLNEDRGDGEEVEELLARTLVKPLPLDQRKPLTTRRDALSLYRAVLRASLLFVWRNERGDTWRDVIRSSARTEFEANRLQRDGEEVNRLLIAGRDALDQTLSRFLAKRKAIIDDEERAVRAGRPPDATR